MSFDSTIHLGDVLMLGGLLITAIGGAIRFGKVEANVKVLMEWFFATIAPEVKKR